MAIDFTTYQPPGIYTENLGGPQLSVRSTVPTAVAIFGRAAGYETYRESLKVRPDVVVGGNDGNGGAQRATAHVLAATAAGGTPTTASR